MITNQYCFQTIEVALGAGIVILIGWFSFYIGYKFARMESNKLKEVKD